YFLHSSADHQDLHSFPTRRSSDLVGRIKTYHIKRLKIAPQFIASMTSSLLDAGAVRMMIHLADTLGIEIIAKSVETSEQVDFLLDRKSTRLNSSHVAISYAVFCLK